MAIHKDKLYLFGGTSSECEKYVCGDFWSYNISGPMSCPQDCSGHGVCEWGFCMCDKGFKGYDCSAMNCPQAVCTFSYSDHWQDCFECSGRGSCAGNGTCLCGPGWKGEACEVLACPGDVSIPPPFPSRRPLWALVLTRVSHISCHTPGGLVRICRRLLWTWHVQAGRHLRVR